MKRALFVLLQFLLFLTAFASGNFLPLFGFSYVTKFANGTRGFQWAGVAVMLALVLLILLVQAVRRRIRSSAPWTLLALALAVAVGLGVWQFGLFTIEP